MHNPYRPVAGDRIRRPWWKPGHHRDVKHVGAFYLIADNDLGDEVVDDVTGEWIKVETPAPLPETWLNVTTSGFGGSYVDRLAAEQFARGHRIAVVHIYTDADGVDHADIERVTS
jgi:hypothetical protein